MDWKGFFDEITQPFLDLEVAQKCISQKNIEKHNNKNVLIFNFHGLSKWHDQRIKSLYLIQLIENPILWIPNFHFPNLRCCKVFWYFDITSYIGIFRCILILIQNCYLEKRPQKVNKQNIRDS